MAGEDFSRNRQPVDVKVAELSPSSRAVNVKAKVVSKSEVRNIAARRDGALHNVCDALIGDETGSVYLTLWDDNIEKVNEGDTINVGNGYVTLFRGNMRLNISRYGTIEISKSPLKGTVHLENNLSEGRISPVRRIDSASEPLTDWSHKLTEYFCENTKYVQFASEVSTYLDSILGKTLAEDGHTGERVKEALKVILQTFLESSENFFGYADETYTKTHHRRIDSTEWKRLCGTAAEILVSQEWKHEG